MYTRRQIHRRRRGGGGGGGGGGEEDGSEVPRNEEEWHEQTEEERKDGGVNDGAKEEQGARGAEGSFRDLKSDKTRTVPELSPPSWRSSRFVRVNRVHELISRQTTARSWLYRGLLQARQERVEALTRPVRTHGRARTTRVERRV